jgi:sec-independent protein translocase protein TatB
MLDIGSWEFLIVIVIALIVVGPERLPKMARTIGLWMGKIRYYVGQVKSDIEREVRAQELKEMLDKPARELEELKGVAEETKGTLDQARGVLGEAKTSFDEASAGASTANEPAAGSIFPTELPDIGPARPESPETVSAPSPETAPPPSDSAETASVPSTETAPVTAGPEPAAPPASDEAGSGVPESPSVATQTRESDERSSERA